MTERPAGPETLDRPEILNRLFFPRRALGEELTPTYGVNHGIEVAPGISIGCRFYPAGAHGPAVLFFHGNGEIAPDYDYIAHFYQQRNISLFVADYRGYGFSDGAPTCSAVIRDAQPIFHGFVKLVKERGLTGGLFVMGRSLGSAPAIEVAFRYGRQLEGLIVESGFASTRNQLKRLGVSHLFADAAGEVGFGNDVKIEEITIPTLIIHGEEDVIIPFGEARALYALSGASDKRFLPIPGAGHNDLMERALDAYMDAVEAFTHGQAVPQ
jgi:hypothetical protein